MRSPTGSTGLGSWDAGTITITESGGENTSSNYNTAKNLGSSGWKTVSGHSAVTASNLEFGVRGQGNLRLHHAGRKSRALG